MTSEGDFWRRQRRMMQPAFHRQVIEQLRRRSRRASNEPARRSDGCGCRRSRRAGQRHGVDEPTDAARRAARDLRRGPAASWCRTWTTTRSSLVTAGLEPRPALRLRVPPARRVRARAGRASGAREHPRTSTCMQMLLEARDAGHGRDDERRAKLIDEVLTLVVAGHETTASALNWTWWLLVAAPRRRSARLPRNRRGVGDLGPASYADLEPLPYTLQVRAGVDAALPARLAAEPPEPSARTGSAATTLPPGTDVFLSPYVVHRHPQFWERPEAFDPGAFRPVRRSKRATQFAYIPFAAGPAPLHRRELLACYEMMLHFDRRGAPLPAAPSPTARAVCHRGPHQPADRQDAYMRVEQR